jgi:hypothetical protein
LDNYVGQTIRLRFRLRYPSNTQTPPEWWIDDVWVGQLPDGPIGLRFTEDFETQPADRWDLGPKWAWLSTQHHSGSWSVRGLIPTNTEDTLTLNGTLDLTGMVEPELLYWTRYNIPALGVARVRVKAEGDADWTWLTLLTNSVNPQWTQKEWDWKTTPGRLFNFSST